MKCASREDYIKRFGEVEGNTRFDIRNYRLFQHSRKQWESKNEQFFIARYGKHEGIVRYAREMCRRERLEMKWKYIIEFGNDIGTLKYLEHVKKTRKSVNNKGLTRDGYISRYGEIEGLKKFNECMYNKMKASQKNTHGEEWFIDKYGEEEGKRKYQLKVRARIKKSIWQETYKLKGKHEADAAVQHFRKEHKLRVLDDYVKEYGEETGSAIFKRIVNKRSASSKRALRASKHYPLSRDGMISKYGEVEGARLYDEWRFKISHSLTLDGLVEKHGFDIGMRTHKQNISRLHDAQRQEYFIEKYGEEHGVMQFNIFKHKKYKHLSHRKFGACSKISNKLFTIISTIIPDIQRFISYATTGHEHVVYDGPRTFLLDFFDIKTNRCIEFYGDFWHCRPDKYNDDKYIRCLGMTAGEKRSKDNARIQMIAGQGIETLVIWEHEFVTDPITAVVKCLDFLNR